MRVHFFSIHEFLYTIHIFGYFYMDFNFPKLNFLFFKVDIKKVCCIISKFKIMTFQLNGDFLCRFMDKVFKGFSQAYYSKGERKKNEICGFVSICDNLFYYWAFFYFCILRDLVVLPKLHKNKSKFFGKINLDIQFRVQPGVRHIYDILLDRYFIHNSNSLKVEEKACKE